MPFSNYLRPKGFTLVEIIVAIVALAISMSVIFSLMVPAEKQSADQLHQIKAAELGQGLLDEILGRAYDDNSDMAGSHWRCDEIGRPACTAETAFGAEPDEYTSGQADRNLFDDVDDYHGFTTHVNSTNTSLDSGYSSFGISVEVTYKGLELNLTNNRLAKRIVVTITTPLGSEIRFTAYKSNF